MRYGEARRCEHDISNSVRKSLASVKEGGGERGGEGRSVGRSVLLCCTHPRGLLFEGVEVGKKVREVVKSEEVEVGRPRSKRGGL